MMLMEDPHRFFRLLGNKDLIVFLYAATTSTIENAMYAPLVEMIEASPFFKTRMKYFNGEYHFENRIKILTGSSIAKNVGLDIFCVFMDEMQVEKSSMHSYNYDNYNSLKARIKSRFMLDGGVFFNTLMILSGSPGSADGFIEKMTEQRRQEVERGSNQSTVIYSTPIWEVMKGKINFSGKTFPVFVGNENLEPKILTPAEMKNIDNQQEIIQVPDEYRKEFEDDLFIAIRDLAGAVTRSTLSYITNVERWRSTFVLKAKIFNQEVIRLPFYDGSQLSDYVLDGKNVKQNSYDPNAERYIHIDLGISHDLTGISMVHIKDFVRSGNSQEPWYVVDFSIGVSRPNNEETSITKIKNFIFFLRDAGFRIKMITTDGYQSTQLRQELEVAGFKTSLRSVIKTSEAFDVLRNAIYQGRIHLPPNEFLYRELLRFKRDISTKGTYTIYYDSTTTESGSHGDISESLAGAVMDAYADVKSRINPLQSFNDDELPEDISAKSLGINVDGFNVLEEDASLLFGYNAEEPWNLH